MQAKISKAGLGRIMVRNTVHVTQSCKSLFFHIWRFMMHLAVRPKVHTASWVLNSHGSCFLLLFICVFCVGMLSTYIIDISVCLYASLAHGTVEQALRRM
mmetsp:Transcript_22227/g.43322  ORF Transcript_22227/g.43322 Transcript_22227/m.43322 type:complete len:100 (+) Transcript_22227:596-895(+)